MLTQSTNRWIVCPFYKSKYINNNNRLVYLVKRLIKILISKDLFKMKVISTVCYN